MQIKRCLGIDLNILSVDLYKLGFSVYQKRSKKLKYILSDEKLVNADLSMIDGSMAPKIWEEYVKNENKEALRLLKAYNSQDIVFLPYIKEMYYQELRYRR